MSSRFTPPKLPEMCDRTGAIYEGREAGMNPVKEEIARVTNPECLSGGLTLFDFEAPGSGDVFQIHAPEAAGNQINCIDNIIYLFALNAERKSVHIAKLFLLKLKKDGRI